MNSSEDGFSGLPPVIVPPTTGNRLVDQATAELVDLDGDQSLTDLPVTDQLARLSAAHEALNAILDGSRDGVQMPVPGVSQPGR